MCERLKRIFSKTFFVPILPIVFLIVLEAILRFSHFNYYPVDPGLTVPSAYTMFQKAGRFYSDSRGVQFKINKPRKEYRIFIFGGSSVAFLGGFYHFKNWIQVLQTMLQKQFPHKEINIVCLGYPSWGTNRLLLLFQEVLAYEPDLMIVYSGHNEFEEEYMKHIFKQNISLLHLNNQLLKISKLYQWASLACRKLMTLLAKNYIDALESTESHLPKRVKILWGITFNKEQIYTNYSHNLNQMARLAKNASVPIIFSTVSYSRHWGPASPLRRADFQFCEFLYSIDKFTQARECFEAEIDSDRQPHRATERTNQIIREISNFYHIPLADVDNAVVANALYNIPGRDLFLDYCHLNDRGNQILIETLYETIMMSKAENRLN